MLGTSPSFPNPGGASSGYLIKHAQTSILLECGHGIAGALPLTLNPGLLDAIVISHMHADHFLDLVPLAYSYRFAYPRSVPVPLWLPPGGADTLERVRAALGLEEPFWHDTYTVREFDPAGVLAIDDLEIRFAHTKHFIAGYAMRFSSSTGGNFGFSSDTAASDEVEDLLRGVDLALIEATEVEYQSADEGQGHLTGSLAGEMARRAGVERLLLTHYATANADALRTTATVAFGKPVDLARQGEAYDV